MSTQVIQIQTYAKLERQERVATGRIANFIESARIVLSVYFSINCEGINFNPAKSVREKAESNAYLNEIGLR